MAYIKECLEKFQELPEGLKNKLGGPEAFALIKELEEKYNVSLSFLVVLWAIGELQDEDIADYLQAKYKLDASKASELSAELDKKIFSVVIDNLIDLDEEPAIGFDKEMILNIFTEQLVETLESSDNEKLQQLNVALFALFQADELFEDKVISLLYNNQERISTERIKIDDQELSPTVANWLKDFISKNSSEMFNNVVLVKYLADGHNVSQLKEADRNLVKKLLKLYRNLVFFPDSMGNTPLEEWEIFPIDRNASVSAVQSRAKKKAVINDIFQEEEGVVKPEEPLLVSDQSKPTKTEPLPASEAPTKQSELAVPAKSEQEELEALLKNYQPRSFEYKTILQEINRLKRQK